MAQLEECLFFEMIKVKNRDVIVFLQKDGVCSSVVIALRKVVLNYHFYIEICVIFCGNWSKDILFTIGFSRFVLE